MLVSAASEAFIRERGLAMNFCFSSRSYPFVVFSKTQNLGSSSFQNLLPRFQVSMRSCYQSHQFKTTQIKASGQQLNLYFLNLQPQG